MAFRRYIRDDQLPCKPADFAKLTVAQQRKMLTGLPAKKQSLLRGFRSIPEMQFYDMAKAKGLKFNYEDATQKVHYTIPAKKEWYLCDFFFPKKDGTTMFIDTKGEWVAKDREKFYLLKQQFPDMDLRIIFTRNPRTQWIGKRGVTSYADICTLGKGRGIWKEFSIPFDHMTTKRFLPAAWQKELIKEK